MTAPASAAPALLRRSPRDADDARRLADALTGHAAAAGIALRPAPPQPTTCCGRGCNGCVWEGYYAALAYWQEEALLALC